MLRALLRVEEGKAGHVVELLSEELPILADPWLTLYGGLALALGFADRELGESARRQREQSTALMHRKPAAVYLYALRLRGEIAASLGEKDTAESLFDELRREALNFGWLPEAAAATLGLASIDAEQGESGGRAREHEDELKTKFGETEGLDIVLAALREYPAQLALGEQPRSFAVSLAATLFRLLRLQGVRSAPLPFI